MANAGYRLVLFFSSFSPLLIIVALTSANDFVLAQISLGVVALVSIAGLYFYIRFAVGLQSNNYGIQKTRMKGDDVVAYFIAYAVAFMDFDFKDVQHIAAFAVLTSAIALVYIRLNLIHINPILYLFGYRYFEADCDDGVTRSLLTKKSYLAPDQVIKCVKLGDYTLMERQDA